MATELSYVLLTPYSLQKSRTGGILARLLSRTELEFAGARVLAFDRATADAYAALVESDVRAGAADSPAARELGGYIRKNFAERADGRRERCLLLLFRGEDAVARLRAVTGRLSCRHDDLNPGETIRDTYADVLLDRDDPAVVRYLEPAVLTPPTRESAEAGLKLLADFMAGQPNLIDRAVDARPGDERTLVILKPENWRCPSSRPGSIIDMLSRTGLHIVGCKLYAMSVAEALEFYGPVRDALRAKLAPKIAAKAKSVLEDSFSLPLPESSLADLTAAVGIPFADDQFARIVEFMSGRRPESCATDAERQARNSARCLALIYEGPDAIRKIRTVLGPTDPSKAPGGTVRRDFGSDVMVNSAHASDAPESVERETRIIRIGENRVGEIIAEFLAGRR